ncbi:MAG: TetR/AcrR family transcriptional regulator [Bacteroidota bacterium]
MTTREKIISAATAHFNQHGFGATSMQELAQHLGMSRGNLTYHFKDKNLLLEAIATQLWDRMKVERAKSRQLPSFQNLHNEIQLYYRFQREYAFVFLDPHVLQHPAIQQQFREMTEQTIRDNKAAIAFAIKLGNMEPEKVAGMYHNLAFTTWMLTFFWLAQQIIRGEKTGEDGEKMAWSILIPHFTEKGIQSFIEFFGESYYQQLGQPFEIEEFISF